MTADTSTVLGKWCADHPAEINASCAWHCTEGPGEGVAATACAESLRHERAVEERDGEGWHHHSTCNHDCDEEQKMAKKCIIEVRTTV